MSGSSWTKRLHSNVGGAFVDVAPIVSPLPSVLAVAAMMVSAADTWLGVAVGIATAAVIELLGFASVHTTLNAHRTQMKAPLWVAVGAVVVYLIAVYWVLVGHHAPGYTLAFPAFTFVGAAVFAIEEAIAKKDDSELTERERVDLDDYKLRLRDQRAAERKRLDAEVSHSVTSTVTNVTPSPVVGSDKASQFVTLAQQNPMATPDEVAALLDVSKRQVYRYAKSAGMHRNGNGWEMK